MAEAVAVPALEEARGWVGAEVVDIGGARVGEAHGLFLDAAAGEPAWLIVRAGRWRGTRLVAAPMRCCAGAPFGVWVAIEGDALRSAPVVDPTRPLRREHELTICEQLGIGAAVGRAAEVADRPEGDITAVPLA